YNGQFVKAFIHVMIFVLLILGADSVSWVFGLLIPFWVLYMVFDAFKTAQARQLGTAPPDLLGIDKLFGIHESQPQPAATVYPSTAQEPVEGTPHQPPAQPGPLDGAPTGAVVLIALGVIFMFSTFGHLNMHRMWPLFLIALGLWIAFKQTVRRS